MQFVWKLKPPHVQSIKKELQDQKTFVLDFLIILFWGWIWGLLWKSLLFYECLYILEAEIPLDGSIGKNAKKIGLCFLFVCACIQVTFTTMKKYLILHQLDQYLSLTLNFPSRQYAFGSDDSLWILEDKYVSRPAMLGTTLNAFITLLTPFPSSLFWYQVVRLFNDAAQMSPEDADVHIVLGVLYNLSREYDKAIASFQTALKLKPRDYSLWNKLGATQANSVQSADAILAYQQVGLTQLLLYSNWSC